MRKVRGILRQRILRQLELLFSGRVTHIESAPAPPRSRHRRKQVPSPASDPMLAATWRQLRQEYFPDRGDLDDYTIVWSSRRQKRVLASCNIRRRKVVVARELYEPSAVRWLSAVLYHELCHAVLGESVHNAGGRRMWHGREFRELERRHPDIDALNAWITSGGWTMAVRSHRSREMWRKRRGAA